MANKSDYVKMIKRAYAASDATLLSKIDALDLDSIEQEVDNEFTVRVIDPPIVKGVDLRNHPVEKQREFYKRALENGGTIKGVFDADGNLLHLASLGSSTPTDVRKAVKLRKVSNKIKDLIKDDFEEGERGRPARPKQMTPDDFWAQFPEGVLSKIMESISLKVDIFVSYGNGTVKWHNHTDLPLSSTAFTGVLAIADIKYVDYGGDLGILVTSINGVASNSTHGWIYWYRDAEKSEWSLPEYSSAKYILHRGDDIAWTYVDLSVWPPSTPT